MPEGVRARAETRRLRAELLDALTGLVIDGGPVDLATAAAVVGQALGARCRLELWSGPERRAAGWPVGTPPPDGDAVVRLAVPYGGAPAGRLLVDLGGRRPRRALRELLEEAAVVLGPVLHAVARQAETRRLEEVSAARADAVATARRQAVAEQEEERRRLERNLHDGAQHHLVALRMTVGLLQHDLRQGAADRAADRLRHLDTLLDVAEDGLAATAAGVLPAVLVADGLLPAFEAELGTSPGVAVRADPAVRERRYPPQVEVAVYFACLEAVNNARKHAPGATVTVGLEHTYQGLAFRVIDDGPGFDPGLLHGGSGLRQLADRIAGAGGELEVRSAPGTGTAIAGFIPI